MQSASRTPQASRTCQNGTAKPPSTRIAGRGDLRGCTRVPSSFSPTQGTRRYGPRTCPTNGAVHKFSGAASRNFYPNLMKRTGAVTNKSAPEEFPLHEIDLLVGWRAGEDEYLFTKAVAMAREWLLDTNEKDRLRDVLKEILAEARPPAGNRPLD